MGEPKCGRLATLECCLEYGVFVLGCRMFSGQATGWNCPLSVAKVWLVEPWMMRSVFLVKR